MDTLKNCPNRHPGESRIGVREDPETYGITGFPLPDRGPGQAPRE